MSRGLNTVEVICDHNCADLEHDCHGTYPWITDGRNYWGPGDGWVMDFEDDHFQNGDIAIPPDYCGPCWAIVKRERYDATAQPT